MIHVGASSTSHVLASPERKLRPLGSGTASSVGVYRGFRRKPRPHPIDLVVYIGRCHRNLRVLNKIQKGLLLQWRMRCNVSLRKL